MSKQANWPNKKGLTKEIHGLTYYLGQGWSLVHGKGWYAQIFNERGNMGGGFHKNNKFRAVTAAKLDLSENYE